MKTILFTLMLLPLSKSFAQFQNGSRVLTTTVGFISARFSKNEVRYGSGPSSTSRFTGFQFQPEISYGKIKNNSLLSYGISVIIGTANAKTIYMSGEQSKSKSRTIGFAPVLSYEKFYLISGNIHYSPFSRLSVGYSSIRDQAGSTSLVNHQHVISGALDFSLFSLTIARNSKTNFLLRAGGVYLNYYRIKSFSKPTLPVDNKGITSNFGVIARLDAITIGLQKVF